MATQYVEGLVLSDLKNIERISDIPNPNRFSGKIFSNASEELLTIWLLITYVVFVVLLNI